MGRRRWRFITLAAFLLCIPSDIQCQDENGFFYTPVERSFAQVQPPLFPNSPPTTYFDNTKNFRLVQSQIGNSPQQSFLNDGHVRFPSPNYNQNPSPFQLPTGRSQSGSQFYLNQPEFSLPQRQKFRPALPHNYQIHPASTKRPDLSQIHSVAYQHDPSKPETFLGQVTINNPDVDFLRNNRFKNIQLDGNSLKPNSQGSFGVINDDDTDDDNQDLFDHHRVTTYNPKRLVNKQRVIVPNPSRFSPYEPPSLDENINTKDSDSRIFRNGFKPQSHDSSTEYKAMLDLEPLLEDEITDITSFRELMKNTQGSFDVQVIKSNKSDEIDSNPSASSMDADNVPKAMPPSSSQEHNLSIKETYTSSSTESFSESSEQPQPSKKVTNTTQTSSESTHEDYAHSEEPEDETEYVEYYDEVETTEPSHLEIVHRPHSSESLEDYEEYDATTEYDHSEDDKVKSNFTNSFDVLVMKPNKTMVRDDNFKQFVDTTVIDQQDHFSHNDTVESNTEKSDEVSSVETSSILGQEVVSVVTTKSVVNGTISIPDIITYAPSTTKLAITSESPLKSSESQNNLNNSYSGPTTTENWVVVASVQTSRSVSGARFLPFPTVEQEEKKQVLTDEENEESVTNNPRDENSGMVEPHQTSSSTENINDKLDSIQSELSSAVLSGSLDEENKNIEIITESTTKQFVPVTSTTTTTTSSTTTTTPGPVNVFTLKSTQMPTVTERSSPDPLPVNIKKFAHRVTTTSSTTVKPKKKLVTVMDDLSPGLLPPGYKPRMSYKDKRTSTTTSTTSTTTTSTPMPSSSAEDENINGTQGRSSGISSKNKVILLNDKSSLVPKTFKPKETNIHEDLFKKFQKEDFSKLLPPGFKLPNSESVESTEDKKKDVLDTAQKVDISSFLPKDFILNKTSTEKPLIAAVPVDISAFLPSGFKLNETESKIIENPLDKFKIADISSLLPPGFKLNTTEEVAMITTKPPPSSNGGFKLVFPSRPGSKPSRKSTTPNPSLESGPVPISPKIQKGWPVRASTEFTGWPSPSTTPFSIEKLLEAQRNATATSPMPDVSTEATTHRITTTSTTTLAPPPSTTPGVCKKECDIAATIKIVSGVEWVPELLDHHTDEWQRLAEDIKEELNSVYSKSDLLNKWYKGIRIDSFSSFSRAKREVLVDYFIELNDIEKRIDTLDLKKLFHKSLDKAKPGSYTESVEGTDDSFDPDIMLGDQPDEERMKKSNEKMTKTIDKSAGKLEMGKFIMDPVYTEFIVLPKREEITTLPPEEESFLPQWGIAVIVIAMASLLFVVIFGVTVLVNRQKSSKAKQPIPLSEDMLRELDKSHMGGFDDLHQLKEREPTYHSGKRMSTAFIEQLAYQNPGDSWRSEWTPQLQKYMQQQHYTPDSGRGSQIYGTTGNGYGYSGSQLYGQTGGGSQIYGYTGEYAPPRSHYSRRRSEYDSNF